MGLQKVLFLLTFYHSTTWKHLPYQKKVDNMQIGVITHKSTILFFVNTQEEWKRPFREVQLYKSSTDFYLQVYRTVLIIRNIRKTFYFTNPLYLSLGCYQLFFFSTFAIVKNRKKTNASVEDIKGHQPTSYLIKTKHNKNETQ